MENGWKVIGHEKQKRFLSMYLTLDSIPHAFMFEGPKGVGKSMIAREFAQKILAKTLTSSPDFIYSDANDLGSEKIRELLYNLSVKPFFGKKKVCIIDSVDKLSVQGSNALLKTLEEPSPSTLIILISGGGVILPTIVSRVISLRFGPLSEEDMRLCFSEQKVDEKLMQYFSGRPGLLKSALDDEDLLKNINNFLPKLSKLTSSTVYERILVLNEMADMEAEKLTPVLEVWLTFVHKSLTNFPERFALADRIMKGIGALSGSMNKKLILQRLLLVS